MTEPTRTRSPITWPAVAVATLLALLAAGAVLLLASDDGSDDTQPADGALDLRLEDEVPSGDPADIEFTDPDDDSAGTIGGLIDGRPMVVNFFASWCTPCVAEMPDFQTVSEELDGRVDFVGLANQDRPEDAARTVETTGVTYPWYRDARGDIVAATGSVQMPTTAFFDAEGNMVEVHAGALDAGELRSMIEEHLGVSV
ncbi:MAG: TlpA disulfide reductase family protein [Acidimicrobiales bacterium]|nr:TlpA disulfide reductase family protein [Acidimicrobiales bacterium]